MNKTTVAAGALSLAVITSGCTTTGQVDKASAGAGLGALTGALLAYGLSQGHSDKEVAILVGTFFGAVVGGEIGIRLTEADRVLAGRTLGDALEYNRSGTASTWRNPDSGNAGTATPTRTRQHVDGSPCREFTTTVFIGGQEEQAYGTACRQNDGSWKILDQ